MITPTDKSKWGILIILYGGLDASAMDELTTGLQPFLAMDQKLARTDLELYPFTPEQEAARTVLLKYVQVIASKYVDPEICTFSRHAPHEPITFCLKVGWHVSAELRYLPWCDETAIEKLDSRFWEAALMSNVPTTDALAQIAVKAGYAVIVRRVKDGKCGFQFWDLLGLGRETYEDPDAAWSAALQNYFAHTCVDVDHGDRVDIARALENSQVIQLPAEDAFFVISDVSYSTVNKIQSLTGWRVNALGHKLESETAVTVTPGNVHALTHAEFEAMRNASPAEFPAG